MLDAAVASLVAQGEDSDPPSAEFAAATISRHESTAAMCTAHQHDFCWAELVNLVTRPRIKSRCSPVDGPQARIAGDVDDTGGDAAMFELVTMVKEKEDVGMGLSMEMDVASDQRSAPFEAWFLYVVAERR